MSKMSENVLKAGSNNDFYGTFIQKNYKEQFQEKLKKYMKYVQEEDLLKLRSAVSEIESEQDNWHETISTLNRMLKVPPRT